MDKITITMGHPECDDRIEVERGSVDNAKVNGWFIVEPVKQVKKLKGKKDGDS